MEKIALFFRKPYVGRIGRLQFLISFIVGFIALVIGGTLMIALGSALNPMDINFPVTLVVGIPFRLFLILASFFLALSVFLAWSLFVRRWHDIGTSGWMILLQLIPGINLILLLVLFVVPGKKEANEYGQRIGSKNPFKILFNNKVELAYSEKYIEVFALFGALLSVFYATHIAYSINL